jgi:hypothetical protein
MSYKVLDRSADLKAVERGVKNAFRWNWLEEKDNLVIFLASGFAKSINLVLPFVLGAMTG